MKFDKASPNQNAHFLLFVDSCNNNDGANCSLSKKDNDHWKKSINNIFITILLLPPKKTGLEIVMEAKIL